MALLMFRCVLYVLEASSDVFNWYPPIMRKLLSMVNEYHLQRIGHMNACTSTKRLKQKLPWMMRVDTKWNAWQTKMMNLLVFEPVSRKCHQSNPCTRWPEVWHSQCSVRQGRIEIEHKHTLSNTPEQTVVAAVETLSCSHTWSTPQLMLLGRGTYPMKRKHNYYIIM